LASYALSEACGISTNEIALDTKTMKIKDIVEKLKSCNLETDFVIMGPICKDPCMFFVGEKYILGEFDNPPLLIKYDDWDLQHPSDIDDCDIYVDADNNRVTGVLENYFYFKHGDPRNNVLVYDGKVVI
tara:strand:- start:17794 stop:18180 length:387 start_codon:yes stop_codon:yes gene_type:complete